jgi:cobalt/nickel transport system permease protein
VFTLQLLFLHRYIFVLTGEAQRLSTARSLRSGGRQRVGLTLYAGLLGHLLLRAFERAQRIHLAMLARGFDGRLRLVDRGHWQRADTLFVAGWCAFFAAVRAVDLPHAVGTLLTAGAP